MYGLKRWVFILAAGSALLTFQMEGRAQGVKEMGLKILDKLMAPNRNLDSTYVFQPFEGWHVSSTYEWRMDKIGLEIPIKMDFGTVASEATLRVKMIHSQSHHVGLRGGYGPISLGYSVALGEKPDRHFSFNWISNQFGLLFHYTKMNDTASSTLEYSGSSSVDLPQEASQGRIWMISGYYAFSHKKFSYPSVYRGKVVQRKSAGSFMVGAKFHHANLRLPESKTILSSLVLNLTGYTTNQFSVGAGYSYNWVLYHRDARSTHDLRSLRNLTFNTTAIPLLTLVNEMRMTHIIPPNANEEIIPVHGGILPNALLRVGLCYTFGHLYINSNLDFHYLQFRSKELTEDDLKNALPADIDYTYRLSVLGHVFNWSAGVEIHYRF